MAKREYLVLLSRGENCWGAYAPDVPGCIATGATKKKTLALFAEALAFHFEGLREDGDPIPQPTACATHVRVAA